jgi:HAMP domain-containing protein
MARQRNLSQKIFWWMAFVGLVPLLIMAVQGYYWAVQDITEDEKAHLIAVLDSKSSCVKKIFEGLDEDFFTAGSSNCIKGACLGYDPPPGQSEPLCHVLDALRARESYYMEIVSYDANWQVKTTSNKSASSHPLSATFKKRLQQNNNLLVYDDLVFTEDSVIIQVGQSLKDNSGSFMAYIVAILDFSQAVSRLIEDESGLGETGKIYVLSGNGRYIAPPKGSSGLLGKKSAIPDSLVSEPGSSVLKYLDWQGIPVLGVSKRSPQIDMLVVAEIDESEVFGLLRHLVLSAAIIGLLTLVIVFFISIKSSKSLSFPLRDLARVAKTISAGNYKERAPRFSDTEIQEVGDSFNLMLDRLEANRIAMVHNASLAAVGELSSSIAHEMKSPLSSIRLNLQALAKKMTDNKTYLEMADISGGYFLAAGRPS